MRDAFWLVTKVAVRITLPFSFEKVILGKNCIVLNQPHENFDFSRDFPFPYVFERLSIFIVSQCIIGGLDSKFLILTQLPSN